MQRFPRHSASLPFELQRAMEGKRICKNYLQSQRASTAKAADFCNSRAASDVLAAAEENLACRKIGPKGCTVSSRGRREKHGQGSKSGRLLAPENVLCRCIPSRNRLGGKGGNF